jgi:hypothetical protein
VAARGGWNGAISPTGSWDDGEDLGGAHRSCGGTRVYRLSLEKTGTKHHRRTGNDATAGGGKRPEEADEAGWSRP